MSADGIVNKRWMPPSPHREAILECLAQGRAHLEERGHNKSPLFVYEDGGVMELSRIRLLDGKLVSVSDDTCGTSTRHVDVCGSIDQLKEILSQCEKTMSDSSRKEIEVLLEQAVYMISRMHSRLQSYSQFAQRITKLSEKMNELNIPSTELSTKSADKLKCFIDNEPEKIKDSLEQLYTWAEDVRKVASDSEEVLYAYRDAAIEIGELYEEIRGARNWEKKE